MSKYRAVMISAADKAPPGWPDWAWWIILRMFILKSAALPLRAMIRSVSGLFLWLLFIDDSISIIVSFRPL
jgi:hypothetical protein